MHRVTLIPGLAVAGVDPALLAPLNSAVDSREGFVRPRRTGSALRLADLGNSGGSGIPTPPQQPGGSGTPPAGQASNQPSSNQDEFHTTEPAHSGGGLSGREEEVDIASFPDDPSDPEAPASEPLADEKTAIVIYAARNLVNTVDTRPTGHGWFSA